MTVSAQVAILQDGTRHVAQGHGPGAATRANSNGEGRR